jgi:hypothetical protein
MSCLGCFGVHTSPGAAIRCWDAYKTRDPYLHSDPRPVAPIEPRKITRLRSGFSSRRNRGGRPRKADASTGRERTRRWREKRAS